MRLVTREELMAMPPGTVYQQWEPCILGELMIKGETIQDDGGRNIDWYESHLGAFVNMNENQFELDASVCREAFFDANLRYLVYDEDNVKLLIDKLQRPPGEIHYGMDRPFKID